MYASLSFLVDGIGLQKPLSLRSICQQKLFCVAAIGLACLFFCTVVAQSQDQGQFMSFKDAKTLLLETRSELIFAHGYAFGREDERADNLRLIDYHATAPWISSGTQVTQTGLTFCYEIINQNPGFEIGVSTP